MFAGFNSRTLLRTSTKANIALGKKPLVFRTSAKTDCTHSRYMILNHYNMMKYFGTIIQIKLPDLGEGTKEATMKEWFVQKGSEVKEFQDLCEVFTDKLVAQIPSTHKGIVKNVYFSADDVCAVGSTLAEIELDDGEATQSEPEKKAESTTSHTPQTPKADTTHHKAGS